MTAPWCGVRRPSATLPEGLPKSLGYDVTVTTRQNGCVFNTGTPQPVDNFQA